MKNLMKRTKEKVQCAALKCMMGIKDFMESEKGASDMVAVIVLIVIVIAIAAIFREQIMNAANKVMESLMDFVG